MEIKPDPWHRLIAIGSIVSVLVVAVGLYLSNEADRAQLDVTLKGQASDRYNDAVRQLNEPGREKLLLRVGAIYALEQLMRNSPPDQPATIEIIAGFVRLNSPLPDAPEADAPQESASRPEHRSDRRARLPMDVQAALTVLARRNSEEDDRAVLTPEGIANNQRSGDGLELPNTYLRGARIDGISLNGADLRGADLREVRMSSARLRSTQLELAKLDNANLAHSLLHGADLKGASLRNATLFGTSFWRADLSGADLRGVTDLSSSQLRCAVTDAETKLPAGVEPPPVGASLHQECLSLTWTD
ncbi:pentapeptide repeat-containing protein [Micromonospora lutea]|uniref:Oxidoreductase n=1 Tax=Micromonospora lutea TaxID=419825 RepID=A0ABQ4INI7_9ACTN|nr:pentapeptide repeat-containing protein [Micromonospora lutea]GIJ19468.1 oxidoreductase [Micromonospora lutea]